MTWFKVDDGLAFHAKVVQAGNAAMGLWVRAGSWSAQQLTDGFVPDHIVTTLGTRGQAKRLCDSGLWHRGEVDGKPGYHFHQWSEEGRQPTRDQVEKDRTEARARMRKAREGKRARSTEVRANTERSSEGVRSTRPGPSRPDPLSTGYEEEGGHVPNASDTPPLYSDRCKRHGNVTEPGPCGDCADARKARAAMPRLSLVAPPAGIPHCGNCDETRHLTTPVGVIRCPECHPLAEESA